MSLDLLKKISFYSVVVLILLFGFLIRLKMLLDNPSFWFDESCLGFNVLSLSYLDFFKPIHLQQVAPPLFMIVSKFFVKIFGQSDLILRLFPFIIGNLTMLMFLLVLKQNFSNKLTICLSLLLFCFNVQAIKFSVEFKPYIVEMFSTCLILYVFTKLNWNYSYKKLALIGTGLAIIPWFAFVSAGMLTAAFLLKFSKKYYKKWIILVTPFAVSLIGLILYYLNIKSVYNDFMTHFFLDSFFNFKEFFVQFIVVFNFLFNISLAIIPTFLFCCGVIYCFVKKQHVFILKFSFLVFLGYIICSFLKIYPFYDRFTLFLFPLILLIIMSIFDKIFELKNKFLIVLVFLTGFILLRPLAVFAQIAFFVKYDKYSCARELFDDMSERIKPTDVIVIDTLSSPDFLYYNFYHNLKNKIYTNIQIKDGLFQYSINRDDPMPFDKELDKFIFLSWPSHDYSLIKADYKNICPVNYGAILYMKKEK